MATREQAITQLNELEKFSERAKHRGMRLAAEDWASDFQTLIAIILSARTLDETTIKVCKKLFEKYPTPEALAKAPREDIERIITPVNFYQNKSGYIINCAKNLLEKYNGLVPHNLEKLVVLPGVGRKTANVFLSENGQDAIGVDTHVNYISRNLGWTQSSKPEKIEKDLKKLFPKELWSKINQTLVRFGKTYTRRTEKDKILEDIKKIK